MPVNEMDRPSAIARRASSRSAGETMKHSREGPLPCFFLEDVRHVAVCLAGVDDERQTGLARGCDMIAEAALLRVARAVIVVVVEAGLPDRDDLGMARTRDDVRRAESSSSCALCGCVPTEQ